MPRPTAYERQESRILTSPVLVAEVRESPDVAQTDGVREAGEQELQLRAPVAAPARVVLILRRRGDRAARGARCRSRTTGDRSRAAAGIRR